MATPKKVAVQAPKVKAAKMEVDMSSITIDAGIPVPVSGGARSRYPFEQLAPGQSFGVRCAAADYKKLKANLASSARRVEKATGIGYVVAVRAEAGEVRVWRKGEVVGQAVPVQQMIPACAPSVPPLVAAMPQPIQPPIVQPVQAVQPPATNQAQNVQQTSAAPVAWPVLNG